MKKPLRLSEAYLEPAKYQTPLLTPSTAASSPLGEPPFLLPTPKSQYVGLKCAQVFESQAQMPPMPLDSEMPPMPVESESSIDAEAQTWLHANGAMCWNGPVPFASPAAKLLVEPPRVPVAQVAAKSVPQVLSPANLEALQVGEPQRWPQSFRPLGRVKPARAVATEALLHMRGKHDDSVRATSRVLSAATSDEKTLKRAVYALGTECHSNGVNNAWSAAARAARTLSAESVALEAALNQSALKFGAELPEATKATVVHVALQLWEWARQGGTTGTAVITEELLPATCLLASAIRTLALTPPPALAPLVDSALARPGSAPAIEELLAIQGAPPNGGVVLQVSDMSNASPALLQQCVILASPVKAKQEPLISHWEKLHHEADYTMKLNAAAVSSAVGPMPYGPQKQFAPAPRRLLIDDLNLPSQPAVSIGGTTTEVGAEAVFAARKVLNARSVLSEALKPSNRRRNMGTLSGLSISKADGGLRLLAPRRPPAIVLPQQKVMSPNIKLPPRVPIPGTCGSAALQPGACVRSLAGPYSSWADLAPLRGQQVLDLPDASSCLQNYAVQSGETMSFGRLKASVIDRFEVATAKTSQSSEVEVPRLTSPAARILTALGSGEEVASWDHRDDDVEVPFVEG